MHHIVRATIHTCKGLAAIWRSELAFRQEAIVFAIAVPVTFVVASEPWKRLALLAVFALILIVELLNTTVEKLCDHVTRAQDPAIGAIKDMGSAAVGLSLLLAGVVWLLALAERVGLL